MRKAGKEELEVETYDSLVGYSMCGQCGYNQTSLKVIDKKTYVDVWISLTVQYFLQFAAEQTSKSPRRNSSFGKKNTRCRRWDNTISLKASGQQY
jgi:uncharacterized protein (UPF0212 family)